jgi:hypothetical protein
MATGGVQTAQCSCTEGLSEAQRLPTEAVQKAQAVRQAVEEQEGESS